MPIRDDHGLTAAADRCVVHTFASSETSDDMPTASAVDTPQQDALTGCERIAGRVDGLLASRRPALWCDDCIADQLGLSHRRQANRVTVAMANTSTFWRTVGACSVCNKHKQVIRHV